MEPMAGLAESRTALVAETGGAPARDFPEPDLAWPEKYAPIRALGRGGFGIVYLARDVVLDRPAAVKFLLDLRPAEVERFRREARIAARLRDPSIVKVYEWGETRGTPYLAMEYIDGPNLLEARLPLGDLVRVVRDVARALSHAHHEGIVHRDLKPQNILLDSAGRPYVTDFGVARDLAAKPGEESLSQDGAIVGTPALMSPEQARGESRSVDARTDVYSLGATLFQLLTGRMPFERSNLVDVLHAVIHEEPPLPRSFDAALPRALESIVLRCLRKDRRERYASMDELAADFERFLAGAPIAGESAAWFRRLVGAPPPKQRPSDHLDPDIPAVTEIGREIATWDANLYRVTRSNLSKTYSTLDSIRERLCVILARRPDFALARFYRGLAQFRRGRLREALEDMERAMSGLADLPTANFELGRLYLALFLREFGLASLHISHQGTESHLSGQRGLLERALIAFEEASRLDPSSNRGAAQYARAVERLSHGEHASAVATCDAILADDADREDVWKLRGDALRLAGGDPIESYDRAIEIRRSFYEAHEAKARALFERDCLADAREAVGRALAIRPDSPDALTLFASIHLQAAPLAVAIDHASRALELDPEHHGAATALAEALLARARESKSAGDVVKALEILDRARGLDGCQNRVEYLTARALLERARIAPASREAALADLQRVLAYRADPGSQVPDFDPWSRVLAEADEDLRRLQDP